MIRKNPFELTETEKKILRLLVEGYSYLEIAKRWKRSVHTVHTHVTHILSKLQVNSRAKAVAYFIKHPSEFQTSDSNLYR